MSTEWLLVLEKSIWFGCAGVGFAVLFNVPVRTLFPIFIMAALGGLTKVTLVQLHVNVIIGSLAGSTLIGFLSIPFAHNKHAPPPVLAIPSVIPMVPGIFAYRMMLGLIKLAGDMDKTVSTQVLTDTIHNGLKVMFLLMTLAAGVGLPMLITRKDSAKDIRFRKVDKYIDEPI
jgi:uncharacterized membrane protein YjjB (DUF3815 family)